MIRLNKPDKCCDVGSYKHQIPMPIKGRVCGIDLCISEIVAALNAGGVITAASCCGHGVRPASVILEDDRKFILEEPNG